MRPGRRSRLSRCWAGRSERGNASVELVLVVPAVVLLMGLGIAGGRIWMAESAVQQSAGAAARAASLDRTSGDAARDAREVAGTNLASRSLECVDSTVSVNTAAFARPVGTPGTVTVHVSCTVSFSDLLLPMPGHRVIEADGVAPLDTYRGRR